MIPQYSVRDAMNERIIVGDHAYLVRYVPDGTLDLKACVVSKILPSLNEIQVVTNGLSGPETLKTNGLELYKNPVTLLEKTIANLELMQEKLPSNIERMKQYLADAKAETLAKLNDVQFEQNQEI